MRIITPKAMLMPTIIMNLAISTAQNNNGDVNALLIKKADLCHP